MHNRCRDLLPYYVKGLLSSEECALLEEHLAECAVCREDVRKWRQIATAVEAESATWVSFLVPPPLKLPGDCPHLRLSDDGNLHPAGPLDSSQAEQEWWVVARTANQRRSSLSSWQGLSRLIAALLLTGLLGGAIIALATIFSSVRGTGQSGGPAGHGNAITPTLIPSPMPTLTPVLVPLLPIEPGNAAQVAQKMVLGQGYSTDVAWSPDGKTLAVATNMDVLLYDSARLTSQPRPLGASVGEVTNVTFSSDGALLAIGGRLGTVLWDMIGGQARVLEQGDGSVLEVAFNPDGTRLAARREDGIVRIWKTSTGQVWGGYGRGVLSMALSPDGTLLASGNADENVQLWEVRTGQPLYTLQGHTSEVLSVAFSPDGARLASGGDDSSVRLWDTRAGEMLAVLEGRTGDVALVAFSPDGQTLAAGNYDNTAHLWDVATGELRTTLEGHTGDVRSLVFSPDGTILATASGWEDHTVRLWDVARGESLIVLEGCTRIAHRGEVGKMAFNPDGSRLALSCGDGGAAVWDVATGQPQMVLWQGGGGPISSLALNPDATILAVGRGSSWTGQGIVQLWDVTTGQERAVLEGHTAEVQSVAFSPDGTALASGSGDGSARVWDAATGESRLILTRTSQPGASTYSLGDDDGDVRISGTTQTAAVWSVAFSPDGTRLAVGRGDFWVGPGSLEFYDAATGELLAELYAKSPPLCCEMVSVFDLAFSPDGTLLATADGDGVVRLWNVATSEELAAFDPDSGWLSSVAFSPDGSLLATGGAVSQCDYGAVCSPDEGEVRLWDVTTGGQLALVEGPVGGVEDVAFNSDGKLIAFVGGGEDGTVSLWDTTTRETVAVLESRQAVSVAFSSDRTLLITGGADGIVRLWRVVAR